MTKKKTGVKVLFYFKAGPRSGKGYKMRFFGKPVSALNRARGQVQKWTGKYDTAIIYDIETDQQIEKYIENQLHH